MNSGDIMKAPIQRTLTEMIEQLTVRYMRLIREMGASATASTLTKLFNEVETRYGEKHRKYHTIVHVARLLCFLDQFRSLAGTPKVIEAAVIYHDVVYDAGAKDNEERSVEVWRKHAEILMFPDSLVSEVSRFILATKEHRADSEASFDLAFFLDLDLLSLAAQPEEFDADCDGIREEFIRFTDEEYSFGRIGWIRSMLDGRDSIFLTPHIRQLYEERAVANLKEESVRMQTLLGRL
jgi:predicted metal-dependent HD superfamily phosphohydrolase